MLKRIRLIFFKDEEAFIVILCIIKIRKLNFMFTFNYFLTVCNRARNSFIILCNFNEL